MREDVYFSGLLVRENLRVDPVELQNEFVHQLRVQPRVSSEEAAVLPQMVGEAVCPREQKSTYISRTPQHTWVSLALAFSFQFAAAFPYMLRPERNFDIMSAIQCRALETFKQRNGVQSETSHRRRRSEWNVKIVNIVGTKFPICEQFYREKDSYNV